MTIVPSKEPTKVILFFGYMEYLTSHPVQEDVIYRLIKVNSIQNYSSKKGVVTKTFQEKGMISKELEQELAEKNLEFI